MRLFPILVQVPFLPFRSDCWLALRRINGHSYLSIPDNTTTKRRTGSGYHRGPLMGLIFTFSLLFFFFALLGLSPSLASSYGTVFCNSLFCLYSLVTLPYPRLPRAEYGSIDSLRISSRHINCTTYSVLRPSSCPAGHTITGNTTKQQLLLQQAASHTLALLLRKYWSRSAPQSPLTYMLGA